MDSDLGRILNEIANPAQRAAARQRAQGFYDDPLVPVTLRARAAAYVAEAYIEEDRMNETCRWYRLASELDPATALYSSTLSAYGCTP